MSSPEFSLADAESVFGPEAMEYVDRAVAAAPPFRPELREQLRAALASARNERKSRPAAKAA
ncbi:hypothetical protein ACF07F_16750 [Streptomyces sp. NPDC015237]|uniref:hypothetical protein n=1 Tax=Streptomyces sp. NPDC015237 TaxID=3364949 RepID=UPI00370021C9